MIAENVVFVTDNDGHRYYVPKDNLEEWDYHVDFECFSQSGVIPYYAVPTDGAEHVVDIKEVL